MTAEVGARMARLVQELASLAANPAAADAPVLERALRIVVRLRAYCDAAEGAITPALERLIRTRGPGVDGDDGRPTVPIGPIGPSEPSHAPGQPSSTGSPLADLDLAELPRESAEELARRSARAKWLRRCEGFSGALLAGAIKGEHIDALATVLDHVEPTVVADVLAEEECLLEVARRVGHVAFGRYVRDVVDRVRADGGVKRLERQTKDSFASWKLDELTGMYILHARLDPRRGGEIAAALQHRVDRLYRTAGATVNLSYGQVVASALHALLTTAPEGERNDAVPSLLIVADAQSVLHGPHAATVCETNDGAPVPLGHAQSLLAEAIVTIAFTDDDGVPLKLGRSSRLASLGQRMALRSMHRHCVFPGCRVPATQTQAHHVTFWDGDDGPTDLENLVPLCRRHHHLVHDDGWRLTLSSDRTARWYRPDGVLHATEPFVPFVGSPVRRRAPPPTKTGSTESNGDDPPCGAGRAA